ncbi:MAG: hypothetical protein ACI8PZ_003087 [Myxococcota bacterium]|jgi:hypothetical protein
MWHLLITAALAAPCPAWLHDPGPLRVTAASDAPGRLTQVGALLEGRRSYADTWPVVQVHPLRVRWTDERVALAVWTEPTAMDHRTSRPTTGSATADATPTVVLAGGVELRRRGLPAGERRPVDLRTKRLYLTLWVPAADIGHVYTPSELPPVAPTPTTHALRAGEHLYAADGRSIGSVLVALDAAVVGRRTDDLQVRIDDGGVRVEAWVNLRYRPLSMMSLIAGIGRGAHGRSVGGQRLPAGTLLRDGPHGALAGVVLTPVDTGRDDDHIAVGTSFGRAELWFDLTAPRCPP